MKIKEKAVVLVFGFFFFRLVLGGGNVNLYPPKQQPVLPEHLFSCFTAISSSLQLINLPDIQMNAQGTIARGSW